MKKRILLIALIGMSFGLRAQQFGASSVGNNAFSLSPIYGDLLMRRYISGDMTFKRALVPSPSQLMINYAGDFSEGVKVQGSKLLVSGNLGIGITSAPSKLTVFGTNSQGWESGIELKRQDGGNGKIVVDSQGMKLRTTQSGDGFYFRNAANATSMYISNDGNVGIGTTNPSAKIELLTPASSFETFVKLKTSDSANDFFVINNATRTNGQLIPNLVGQHTSDNRQALYLTGRIGENNDVGTQPIMIFDSRITNKPVNNRPLFGWDSYGSRRMTLDAKGNLGIGTTNPDSKLSVNGKIHAKEVKVDLIGWSDFVFEKEYHLPTLKEVEIHIKENGHLKDIPSAKEVEKNGIFLGEMNAKLLQKIEELTLYTIDQEKRLKGQKAKNCALESRLSRLEKLFETSKKESYTEGRLY